MLKALKKRINAIPLRIKISCIIVPAALLFVTISSLTGMQVVVVANVRQIYQTMAASLDYAAIELVNNLHTADRIATSLVVDETVQSQLDNLRKKPEDVQTRAAAFRQVNSQMQAFQSQFPSGDVFFINVDTPDLSMSTNTVHARRLSEQVWQEIRRQAVEQDGRPLWLFRDNMLILSRRVRQVSPLSLEPLGVMTIGFDLDRIIGRCTNFHSSFDQTYYMLLEEGQVAYHSEGMPQELMELSVGLHKDYQVLNWNGHRYFAVRGQVDELGWEYISLVSYDEPYQAMLRSRVQYLAVTLLSLAMALVLCFALMRQLTMHIDKLVQKMKAFGQSNTRLKDDYDYSQRGDEIGLLHRRFDRMADQIEHLIQTDYTNKLLMKEAQLKALEAQIDPHFLYNVLASINWRAKAIGEVRISQMVQALSKLLRASLSNASDGLTLAREMELVNSYATIQMLRFEDQLSFESDVPQELCNALLPKLTLQPLIENAIRYGMSDGTEICRIRIQARREGDLLRLRISNTGSRFEEDILEKLRAKSAPVHGFGIGILNIQQRLQYTFGENYGLRFSNEDGCAVVTMEIPYRPAPEPPETFVNTMGKG